MAGKLSQIDLEIFAGLKSLVETAFPKSCMTCGRVYETAEAFAKETETVNGRTGLKASQDDDGTPLVELFRNCVCGSTLMDAFCDRRDQSETGLTRRTKFGSLLVKLIERGVTPTVARLELLRVLRGETSEVLSELLGRKI